MSQCAPTGWGWRSGLEFVLIQKDGRDSKGPIVATGNDSGTILEKNMDGVATSVSEEEGLLFACRLDGSGSATLIGWDAVESWQPDHGPLWVHLDRDSPRVQDWLINHSGLTAPTSDALIAEETRPRVFHGKQGFVAILRGVNTNVGADAADMVAMRMWSDGQRVITIRQERLMTPRDVLAQLLELGTGPINAASLFERLIHRINERMADAIDSLDEQLEAIEVSLDLARAAEQRKQLSEIRLHAAIYRRYISPQKDALTALLIEPPAWFGDDCMPHLRESIDRLLRYLEDIDTARERATVIKDDISNQARRIEQQNPLCTGNHLGDIPAACLSDRPFGRQCRRHAGRRQPERLLDFLRHHGGVTWA
ncbi:CorA family divalent cation transporter [Devosia algicola]|uniref:CorA family divalent cation transporter n=1 Tax=Devosia algicola TaxID=3026418 RepID=A0ABY7YLG1_9HYPH|nr:CorA family divalent cation transporter [Devosia algicola]WDR01930.1 CorA family divalent cation transporter [Devosia algicola]